MTADRMELPPEVRSKVDAHLDAVEQALRRSGAGREEARSITDDVETQILDMLTTRAAGRTPTVEDASAVLAQLDPPEAYTGSAEARTGAGEAQAVVLPAAPPRPPAKPKFCRTALLALLGFVPIPVFVMLAITLGPFVARVQPVPGGAQAVPSVFRIFICCDVIPLIAIPLIGMLWTTILGIVAIFQIHRAKGQRRGMGLAIFDAVAAPAALFLIVIVLLLTGT
ncbi:MAG: hypothetical protein NTU94_02190 [Planctomycetota bacterium]|nr:hypothetical protein [Planctomycetota bacterium]